MEFSSIRKKNYLIITFDHICLPWCGRGFELNEFPWMFLSSNMAYCDRIDAALWLQLFKLNHYKVGFLPFFSPSPLLPFSPSSPSCQSNLLILNISAKSSPIFTKFWGKLPLGILRWLKQKTNEYINKQTNKQTNKHFPV